jgi:hypothetical protein
MRYSVKRVVALGFLAIVGALAGADMAAACTADCVLVSAPFCRRCMDVGEFTGITCQNFSTCGCFYTHNTCSQPQEEDPIADLGLAAVEPGICTDGNATAESAGPRAHELFLERG